MKTQANTNNIFSAQNPLYPQKQLYADSLSRQMRDQELRRLESKRQEQLMDQKQVVQQTYDSPFGKDRIKQLQFINSQLAKPIYNVEDFVQRNNFEEMLRPKTRFTTRQNTQNHSHDYQDDQKQQQTQQLIELTPGQKYIPPPILTNRSGMYPPKTPGTVYDGNNNPVNSNYVSTYDQQHSHKWKQEKSNEVKELNNINAAYLSNLLKQLQGNKSQQFIPNSYAIQQPPQSHRGGPMVDQIDLLKQQEYDRLREQERYQEYQRQQQLQEQEYQRQQQLAEQKNQEEQKMKALREQIERELEEQRRLNQQENEVQTYTEMQNTGTQHVDHNAVTASQYMDSLKQLSGSVIDMKNQFIQEQSKLKYELIQLKDKQIKDIEEKQRVQKELRELEQRHKAFKVWEGEKQNQLMQALAKNAPIPNIHSQNIDYSKLNPTLKKVTRFRDQTLGYEYDESNGILSKSNLVPMNYNYDNNRNLHNLRDEAPMLPEELDRAKDDVVPKLNYSNQVTKDLRLKDFNDRFYDYKYQRQGEQNVAEQFEQEKHQRNNSNMDPNRVLLENDRRLYELNILDPKSDQEQVQELYSYI